MMPLWSMIAAPLAGALALGLMASFGRSTAGPRRTRVLGFVACAAVLLSFVAAVGNTVPLLVDAFPEVAAGGAAPQLERTADGAPFLSTVLYSWIATNAFAVDVGFKLDALSALMVLVITGVGFLIHLYAAAYMADDPGYGRFFCYMNLFVAAMLTLVLADNLLLLFLGWEGVGVCSYLLIGFWYTDPANGAAARKAFIVTRVGDAALLIGLFIFVLDLGTLQLDGITEEALARWVGGHPMAALAATLLLVAAVGKSAQIPLQIWLPDAMAGPTPVSALLHAATMVTAGVYLIARTHEIFLLAPAVLMTVATLGGATAFFAACAALAQHDIKRLLAYSTISQIGYMFAALGVAGFSAAMFHFTTHAFFKALLFLSAGNITHCTDGETDLRRFGGLRRSSAMPGTAALAAVGAASLAGLPLITAGFYSKDAILWATLQPPFVRPALLVLLLLTALLTSLYAFRWYFMIFAGPSGPAAEKVTHRPRDLMLYPLVALAAGSLLAGFLEMPETLGGYHAVSQFLDPVFEGARQRHALGVLPALGSAEAAHRAEITLQGISAALSLLGILFAYHWFVLRPAWTERVTGSGTWRGLERVVRGGWGADEMYALFVVLPFRALAGLLRHEPVDDGVAAVVATTRWSHRLLALTQSGRIRTYAGGMVLGAALLLIAWMWG